MKYIKLCRDKEISMDRENSRRNSVVFMNTIEEMGGMELYRLDKLHRIYQREQPETHGVMQIGGWWISG
jgi:hypothetical protein